MNRKELEAKAEASVAELEQSDSRLTEYTALLLGIPAAELDERPPPEALSLPQLAADAPLREDRPDPKARPRRLAERCRAEGRLGQFAATVEFVRATAELFHLT